MRTLRFDQFAGSELERTSVRPRRGGGQEARNNPSAHAKSVGLFHLCAETEEASARDGAGNPSLIRLLVILYHCHQRGIPARGGGIYADGFLRNQAFD